MTYQGHVENGIVVLDDPVPLPDGARVEVAVLNPSDAEKTGKPIWMVAVEMGASVPPDEWDKMPTDASKNLDHYLYGVAKRDE